MKRHGFTLVEVMVALVVASLLAILAHRVFGAGITAAGDLTRARRSLDRTEGAHRFVASAFQSLEIGANDRESFEGRPDRVRFSTWLETSDGWFEPVTMEIALDGSRLVVNADSCPPLVLTDSVTAVGFDYLLDYGAEERWMPEWISPLSAPIGIRLRIYHAQGRGQVVGDTTLYIVKARG